MWKCHVLHEEDGIHDDFRTDGVFDALKKVGNVAVQAAKSTVGKSNAQKAAKASAGDKKEQAIKWALDYFAENMEKKIEFVKGKSKADMERDIITNLNQAFPGFIGRLPDGMTEADICKAILELETRFADKMEEDATAKLEVEKEQLKAWRSDCEEDKKKDVAALKAEWKELGMSDAVIKDIKKK